MELIASKSLVVCFVNTTGVHPKVLVAIPSSLVFAELDLIMASLVLASAFIRSSKVTSSISTPHIYKKYRIRKDFIVANENYASIFPFSGGDHA